MSDNINKLKTRVSRLVCARSSFADRNNLGFTVRDRSGNQFPAELSWAIEHALETLSSQIRAATLAKLDEELLLAKAELAQEARTTIESFKEFLADPSFQKDL